MKELLFGVGASYLEVVFFVDRQAVRKDIARNNHVGLVSVHGEPVHP